jgi:hypothetical protein
MSCRVDTVTILASFPLLSGWLSLCLGTRTKVRALNSHDMYVYTQLFEFYVLGLVLVRDCQSDDSNGDEPEHLWPQIVCVIRVAQLESIPQAIPLFCPDLEYISLLTSKAIVDSHDFAILSSEQVEELNQVCGPASSALPLLNYPKPGTNRLQYLARRLALKPELDDAAAFLSKVSRLERAARPTSRRHYSRLSCPEGHLRHYAPPQPPPAPSSTTIQAFSPVMEIPCSMAPMATPTTQSMILRADPMFAWSALRRNVPRSVSTTFSVLMLSVVN